MGPHDEDEAELLMAEPLDALADDDGWPEDDGLADELEREGLL